MKLLLTSSGLDNRSIAAALTSLVGKPPAETKIGFIPTAANAEDGNKDWFINSFLKLWRHGYNWIDMVDPSAADFDWMARLETCDVIYINGGNTFHLLDQSRKTGFDKWLENNKETKVFVGSSAGSILLTPTIAIAAEDYGDENKCGIADLKGSGWVDFEVAPHFEQSRVNMTEGYHQKAGRNIYAIDDQSAVKVDGSNIEVVSEGFWRLFEGNT